jgi:hypothetical protein
VLRRPEEPQTWIRAPPGPLIIVGPFVYWSEDIAPSRRRGGFDPHTGYSRERSGRGKAWPIRKLRGLETAGSNPAALTLRQKSYRGPRRWPGPNAYPGTRCPARGRGVAAACRPFKPVGGGSSPSGPMAPSSTAERSPYKRATRGSTPPAPTNGRREQQRPVVQRDNTRLITGRWRFDSFLADS